MDAETESEEEDERSSELATDWHTHTHRWKINEQIFWQHYTIQREKGK